MRFIYEDNGEEVSKITIGAARLFNTEFDIWYTFAENGDKEVLNGRVIVAIEE